MDGKVFCFVAGAMVFVFSGRGVETGVVRNVQSSDEYPFIDGLRVRTERPVIDTFDTSDFEEAATEDGFPFVDGLRKIPRRFGLPEIDLKEGAAVRNDGKFPFGDGLRRTEKPSGFDSDEDAAVGNDGEFPFRDGLRRTAAPREFESIFDDEAKVGDDGDYPFVDGVRRGSTTPKSESEDFEKTDEEYPFVNGLRKYPPHAMKKRSVGALADNTDFLERRREISHVGVQSSEEINAATPTVPSAPVAAVYEDISHNDVHRFAPGKSPNHQGRGTPKATRFKAIFGEKKEGDIKLSEKVYKKPIIFGVSKVIVKPKFPEGNAANKCTISYIVVENAQTIGDLEDDDVFVISGGIGQTDVGLKIISPNFYLYSYRVTIYGRCP